MKMVGVHSTFSAVFPDLSNSQAERTEVVPATCLSIDDNQIDVGPAAYDAYRVRLSSSKAR